jgi:High-temperature-induced dauer-formation protein
MTSSKGKLDAVYPALMAILKNIGPYVEKLSSTSCSKILQLFASMSSPSFLLANETNNYLLSALLEFINVVLEHQFTRMLSLFTARLFVCDLTNGYKGILSWFTVF